MSNLNSMKLTERSMKSQDFKWQGFIHLAAVDLVSPMGLTYSTDDFNSDTDTVQSDSEGSGHSDEAEADITIDRIAENSIRAPASANTAAVRGVDRGGGRYGRTAGQGTSAMSGTVPSGSSVNQDKGRGRGRGRGRPRGRGRCRSAL